MSRRALQALAEYGEVNLFLRGIVPMIDRFSAEHYQYNLAVSLHAPNDGLRARLMPVDRAYPLDMKAILICSDGLHGYVPEDTIRKIIVTEAISTQLKARGLVQAALAAGGYDNVTVILIEPEGDEGE